MIKNSIQLKNAEKRLSEIQKIMFENGKKYAGLEFEMQNIGLAIEESELFNQIIEYKKLKTLPFSEAISFLFTKPILIDNIGDLLSKLRIAAKLSQSDMAQRLGWKQSNLSRFENENYSSQSISKIVEYASSLGVWLHIRPSLTEEPGILDKGTMETKPYEIITKSADSTSMAPFEDEFDVLSLSSKNIPTSSNLSEVISI